jgi:hypothetical protein
MRKAARMARATCVVTLLAAVGAEAGTGVLGGTVRLAGTPPARPALEVFKNPEVCGDSVPDDRLVVGPGGGLRYAIVTVDGVRGGKKPERDVSHVLDNRACRFEPHVQVAEVGQWLELENSDPLLHNADARIGQETLFNVALPPARHLRRPLARTGLITVNCDVRHVWMRAFVDVTDHPYHTVTDMYGAYEIRDLPPGTYTVHIWHELLGTREERATIEPGQTATLDVTYPAVGKEASP